MSSTEIRIVFENRASTIIYNFFKYNHHPGKILLPANICPIVPITLLKLGKRFEFLDINKRNFCMDQNLVIEQISHSQEAIAGIIFVRTYGFFENIGDFFSQVKELDKNILIVDDRCACPPDFDIKQITDQDLVIYSTGYAKYVDIGFGGFGYIKSSLSYSHSKLPFSALDMEKIEKKYKICIENRTKFKYKDSNWLNTKKPQIKFSEYKKIVKKKMEKISSRKDSINEIYKNNLPKKIQLNFPFQNWRFNILVSDKEKIIENIFKAGLFASSHYASLDGIFSDGTSQNAELLHSRIINLFNDRYFSIEQAQKICEIINKSLQ